MRKQDKCVTHAVPARTKIKRAKQRAKLATLGRTIQNKDKHLYPAVNYVKKVISAHQRLRLKNALLEHTKMKRAKQHAKTAILGRIIQNKDNYLVNHVKKVISADQRQILNKNALLEHTKMKRANQHAKTAILGRIIQNKDSYLVNHVKKVISVHQRQILKQNAPQIHTKIKQAKQRANNALATKFRHQDQRLAMI